MIKKVFKAYKKLIDILFSDAPIMVILTFALSILWGLVSPVSLWVNKQIFDQGIEVAKKNISFSNYLPILILFLLVNILPMLIKDTFINGYVNMRSRLILRSELKSKMLMKCRKLKYEHFENDESLEIIEKAYNRAEESANIMFPKYISIFISSSVAAIGFIIQLFSIKWWLLITILTPFIIQTIFVTKKSKNIYDELEKYWNKEKRYKTLAGYLRSRDYNKEIKLFGIAPYLINVYGKRLNKRNREYEKYYFSNLKKNLFGYNLIDISVICNVLIFLVLFIKGTFSTGLFISLTSLIIAGTGGGIYKSFKDSTNIFSLSGYHINFFDYYNKYFNLSEKESGKIDVVPNKVDIEFKNIWFKYPKSYKYVLKDFNMKINSGECVSLVGENGEGKSTLVKLLLGLFFPNKGQILLNGIDLKFYSQKVKSQIFAPIFQDFVRYSFSLSENIGIGNISQIKDLEAIKYASKKSGVENFIERLPNGYDTVLNRDFEGGVDISGGQWQRIAIARAFIGNKLFFILDEPTSQLDPMAESKLYDEFSKIVNNKTSLFITHRLASTKITDKIFVMKNGMIEEEGSHEELMKIKGIYYTMFNAQKQWYKVGNNERNREDSEL